MQSRHVEGRAMQLFRLEDSQGARQIRDLQAENIIFHVLGHSTRSCTAATDSVSS